MFSCQPRPLSILSILTMLLVSVSMSAAAEVVVSIKPLQLIARELLGVETPVRVLIAADSTPHHYTMTPSDRLALGSAELIVYIGEALETELHQALENLGPNAPVLEVMAIEGLTRLPLASAVDGDSGSGSQTDPHVWLDTGNGLLIGRAIVDALVHLNPERKAVLSARLETFEARLTALDSALHNRLVGLPQTDYVVYHDAIGYFESRYGRQHALVLVDDTEIQPGMRHLLAVREALASRQPACLLTDITVRTRVIETVLPVTRPRIVMLDLLGSRLDAGAGYPELIEVLADEFINCLSGEQL